MKVEPTAAVQSHPPVHSHEPRTKAKAHGLVRQLQEDTFNGASAEKHRARFADRLTETAIVDASLSNDPSQIEPTDVATTEAPVVSPSTLDPVESEGGLLDASAFTLEAPAQWYGDQIALVVFGKSGQNIDWTA